MKCELPCSVDFQQAVVANSARWKYAGLVERSRDKGSEVGGCGVAASITGRKEGDYVEAPAVWEGVGCCPM